MKIHYYSYLISEELYHSLYTKENKPGMQVQVFNKLVVDGLIQNEIDVKCISTVPTSNAFFNKIFPKIKNDNLFEYLKVINIPIIKDIYIFISTYFKILRNLKKEPDLIHVCDVLCPTSALAMSLAAKKLHKPCIGIVTDIPEFFETNCLFIKMTNQTIQNCSSYIFLTEAMNEYLNKDHKPYEIIEGMCQNKHINQQINRENTFMYAGSIDKVNGIDKLVDAFKDIETHYELHIYGSGDYQIEIEKISLTHPNIKYFGQLSHEQILKKIQSVAFLINPRGLDNPMVKYSFPSKNLEYMASGTPFLCTKLPCIPNDYFEYINVIESDDVIGIKKAIEKAINQNYSLLLNKASLAQKFVLTHKNNKEQTKKIIKLIEEN